MSRQPPRPLRRGRITAGRVNELVGARLLDVVGDGRVIEVRRTGPKATVSLNIENLIPRIPRGGGLRLGEITAFSTTDADPNDIYYSVRAYQGGAGAVVYTNRKPIIRWTAPGGGFLNAAAVNSVCVLIDLNTGEGEDDVQILIAAETIASEACQDAVDLGAQLGSDVLLGLLSDATDRFITDLDGLIVRGLEELTAAQALSLDGVQVDATGAPVLDQGDRLITAEVGSDATYDTHVLRILIDDTGQPVLDLVGNVVLASN